MAFGIIPFGLIGDLGKGLGYVDDVADVSREFESFAEFKKVMGAAGEGKEWHHIVEQSQVLKSGFSQEMINSTDNILAVDKATHGQISGFYSSLMYGTNIRVRNWLAGQSFEEQYKFGLKVLKKFGVIP